MNNMYLIDTHSHIYYDTYKNNLDEIINRAKDNNIKKIICVGVDLKTSEQSIKIAEKYNCVYATVGYHPHDSQKTDKNYLKEIEKLYSHDKVVAIGEIGLDYYYKHSPKKIQQKIFNEQLELAKSLNAPVVIHNRLSDADLLNSLKEQKITNGVIHCFASNLNFAKSIINLGLFISFTGLITFVKDLEEVVEKISINNIMIETDSPYLTPIPNRGKTNEPYMVKYIAEKIASIKKIPIDEVIKKTTSTANNFFGI